MIEYNIKVAMTSDVMRIVCGNSALNSQVLGSGVIFCRHGNKSQVQVFQIL